MTVPGTASFSEFAAIAGCKPGYVTQLRKDDRLVLTDDAKRVRVAESLDRIAATKDPARIGVSRRHAAERTAAAVNGEIAAAPEPEEDPEEKPSSGFQHWRERGERAKALAAERENDIADGKLLIAADVEAQVASVMTLVRTRLEGFQNRLAAQVIGLNDEGQARAIIAEHVVHVLTEMSREFGAIAKVAA